MPLSFDGPNKLISLDSNPTVSIRSIYSRWIDWVASLENTKYLPAFSVIADPPTVPVYATLINGWKIRPVGGDYILTLNDGFLYTEDDSDPFADVISGEQPKIRFQNPVVAVGYPIGNNAFTLEEIADAVWTREPRTVTNVGPGGDTSGIMHVIGDTIIIGDETATTISEIVDTEMTIQEDVNQIVSDTDTSIELPAESSTATVEPDSTLGDS